MTRNKRRRWSCINAKATLQRSLNDTGKIRNMFFPRGVIVMWVKQQLVLSIGVWWFNGILLSKTGFVSGCWSTLLMNFWGQEKWQKLLKFFVTVGQSILILVWDENLSLQNLVKSETPWAWLAGALLVPSLPISAHRQLWGHWAAAALSPLFLWWVEGVVEKNTSFFL